MIKAKVQTPRKFFFLYDSADVDRAIQLDLKWSDGSEHSETSASAVLAVPGLYVTEDITFTQTGSLFGTWLNVDDEMSPVILGTFQLSVVSDPIADYAIGVPRKFIYQAPSLDETISDLVLTVYDEDEEEVATSDAAMVAGLGGIYETDDEISLDTEGVYAFVWESAAKGYSYTQMVQYLVLPSPDTRTIRAYVIDTSVDPQVPQVGVKVLISETDGTPLYQAETDSYGKALFNLRDGDYVMSALKAGYTYSKNNVEITVAAPSNTNNNYFYLFATPFQAVFDAAPPVSLAEKSLMTIDLVDMSGDPICGTDIIVSSHLIPDTAAGSSGTVGIMEAHRKITTNGVGHAELYLLRGAKVDVAFEGTAIRRTITVPDQETFNLLDIATEDGDPWDINILEIAAAVRRAP